MNVQFLRGTAAAYAALETKDAGTFYALSDTSELYFGSTKISNGADLQTLITRLDADENTANSIRNIAKSYIAGLDTVNDVSIASVSGDVVTIKAGLTETDGIIANSSGTDIVLSAIATTGDAEDVAYDNTESGLTATDVQAAIDELSEAAAGGVDSKTIYITQTSGGTSDTYGKRYGVYQGSSGSAASPVAGEKIIDIDIPKDMFVEGGSVGTVTTADEPYAGAQVGDKYINLVLANATSDHIYIPANSLVDIYSAESSATQIQLAIDSNNVISATVVAGSIGTTELAGLAVTTAKIADTAVTTAKIADDAVTADKVAISAHSETQTAGTDGLALSVTTTDGQVSAVSGSIIANTYDNYGAASDVQDAVTGDASTDTSDSLTLNGLKKRIDAEATRATTAEEALDGRVDALEAAIGTGGSVDEKIADAIEGLDGSATIASVSSNVVTIKGGITEADGVVDNDSSSDIVLEEVAVTGAAADVSIADAGSYTSQTTVEGAIQEIYGKLQWVSF